MNFEKF
jgi:ubiquitin carboxyl-terminal hydrolase 4/11/15